MTRTKLGHCFLHGALVFGVVTDLLYVVRSFITARDGAGTTGFFVILSWAVVILGPATFAVGVLLAANRDRPALRIGLAGLALTLAAVVGWPVASAALAATAVVLILAPGRYAPDTPFQRAEPQAIRINEDEARPPELECSTGQHPTGSASAERKKSWTRRLDVAKGVAKLVLGVLLWAFGASTADMGPYSYGYAALFFAIPGGMLVCSGVCNLFDIPPLTFELGGLGYSAVLLAAFVVTTRQYGLTNLGVFVFMTPGLALGAWSFRRLLVTICIFRGQRLGRLHFD